MGAAIIGGGTARIKPKDTRMRQPFEIEWEEVILIVYQFKTDG